MLPLAVYIHWPFCKHKCPYCDFNSHVRERVNHPAWKDAYLQELRFYREKTGDRKVSSVFFGGGTPSLMVPETIESIINEVGKLWTLENSAEITLEANPTSVEAEKLRAFKSAGVNRVSLGVQSLRDEALKKLGRQHSAQEAIAAVSMAAGIFDRFSFDLIYARPGQKLEDWQQELGAALEMGAPHMSLYQLTIEEGTQYHTLHRRGELVMPEENLSADMYELTQDMTRQRGLIAYEISNHAKEGQESRHNLAYWRYHDYLGIGPGAHGRLTLESEKWATKAHKAPEIWLQWVKQKQHGGHPFEKIDSFQRGRELLLMGLRLKEGVSLDAFYKETQTELSFFVGATRLRQLVEAGFLEERSQQIIATPHGRQRLNAVISFLLSQHGANDDSGFSRQSTQFS